MVKREKYCINKSETKKKKKGFDENYLSTVKICSFFMAF